MTPTDVSEFGLEGLITRSLAEAGYEERASADVDKHLALDVSLLLSFLQSTQPDQWESLGLSEDGPLREQFLSRISSQIERRGVVDVLRKGIRHNADHVELYFALPSEGNEDAATMYERNVFSVVRQLHYSEQEPLLSVDLVLFVNGLPVATMELKNNITKQTVHDAIAQYKRDRNPREPLFAPGRCAVHFAVDDQEVWMCAALAREQSWFLPFNKGNDHGAGNPVNPVGLKTDYLWKQLLIQNSLSDILENYAQDVQVAAGPRGQRQRMHLFPRFHQLDVVRALLRDSSAHGIGRRYLVQHSAGSGKSNSIAWLVQQLVELRREGEQLFDAVVVVTDRTALDRHIRDNIRQFSQVSAVMAHAQTAAELSEHIVSGKKVIITTVQKFPFVVSTAQTDQASRRFAVVIDEAHSSQGGRAANTLNRTLGTYQDGDDDEEAAPTPDDVVARTIAARGMPTNVSFFAFTATPKSRTLRLFGTPDPEEPRQFRPFHVYSMRQAIDEGFIVDVLEHYTPVASYYRLVEELERDREVDVREARKELRRYVEEHPTAVTAKAGVIVEHFHGNVVMHRKIGGRAKAMVVASGVNRAIAYYHAINNLLRDRNAPYRALVAFSGERDFRGQRVSETSINGFPASETPARFKSDEYRLLVVAQKYQTGFDEPLLHSMYVDKKLAGVQAVQTLSRLNRAHPQKRDTFVLDFADNAASIERAFSDYYTTTLLARDTDPNKLHDWKRELDDADVYEWEQVETAVRLYLEGADRDSLDPLLDVTVHNYLARLDEGGQIAFKSNAKRFVRTYNFLSCILPYGNAEWEVLSTYLSLLIGKLPSPRGADDETSILDAIDMDSFRVEVKAVLAMDLDEADAFLEMPTDGGEGRVPEREHDLLSAVVASFNEQFGNIQWRDADKVRQAILFEIPQRVAADPAYQNALRDADTQNARVEHDRALGRVITDLLADHTELFKQFSDNESFRRWMQDNVFAVTSERREPSAASLPAAALPGSSWDTLVGPFFSEDKARRLSGRIGRELLALTTADGFKVFPSFQVRGSEAMPGLHELLALWPEDLNDQWSFAAWLVSPQVGLDGASVVDRLWAEPDDTHLALYYVGSYLHRVAS